MTQIEKIKKYATKKIAELEVCIEEETELLGQERENDNDEGMGYCEGQLSGLVFHKMSMQEILDLCN